MRISWTSRDELEEYRDARLRRLLVHAYERVPYYRRLFDRHRLHPRHVRGAVDLDLIPVTTKQDLRGLADKQVLASGLDPARMLSVRTSGSTGEPFTIRRTWLEDKRNYLLRLRALRSLGVRLGDCRVAVGVVRPSHPNDRKLLGTALRALGISRSFRLDGLQEPEATVRALRQLRPDVITGMPGMLGRVADYLLSSGGEPVRPRVLIVGGEMLTPVMKRRLTDAFDAPVRQTYASHEFPLLGWECTETGQFHVCDDGVILEVLHKGRPAEPGESGEVVVTNLSAYAMPFIRYRLGDVATRGDEHCACGQPFSTIRAIQGRMIDSFTLPDGRVLHPYQILTKMIGGGDSWIRQYQLLQERKDRIVLRVLPTQPSVSEHIAEIERSIHPLLGPGVEFQVQLIDEMPLEPSGKFRPSRSLVRSEYEAAPAVPHGPSPDHSSTPTL
jgi:phenylacetate-CoA ligase